MGRLHRPVLDRTLADELAQLRYDAGLTQAAAAALIPGWSASRISRIENGLSPIELTDLPTLLDVCQAGPDKRTQLLTLAERAAPPAGAGHAKKPADSKLDLILTELTLIRELLEKMTADRS